MLAEGFFANITQQQQKIMALGMAYRVISGELAALLDDMHWWW